MPSMSPTSCCFLLGRALIFAVVLIGAGSARPCRALHFDYLVEQDPNGQLVIGSNNFDTGNTLAIPVRVFNRDLDETFFGSDPGFSAVSAVNVPAGYSALPANTPLSFDLLATGFYGTTVSNLWYWNGAGPVNFQPVSDGTSFKLSLGSFSAATVDGAAAGVPGFVVQTTDGSGAMHRHPNYQLQGTQSQGLYIIAEHARMVGLKSSIPFFTVFVTDAISDTAYNTAVAWADKNLSVLGDVNTDGIVDISDVQTIAAHWLQTAPGGDTNYIPLGDANYDRIVDISDVQTVAAHWLEAGPSGQGMSLAMVPEPASWQLAFSPLAVALVILACRATQVRRWLRPAFRAQRFDRIVRS